MTNYLLDDWHGYEDFIGGGAGGSGDRSMGVIVGPGDGIKGEVTSIYNGTLTAWSVIGSEVGNIEIDVQKSTWAGVPPTTSIVGSDAPELVAAQRNRNTGPLSGWSDTTVAVGDVFEFSVVSGDIAHAIVQLTITTS